MKSKASIWVLANIFIAVIMLIGEVKCIIKMFSCNWEPIGKAEVIYTAGTFTGIGVVIGYLNIDDK